MLSFIAIILTFDGWSALWAPHNIIGYVIISVFVAAITVSGYLLASSNVTPHRYPRAVFWTVGSSGFLLALNVPLFLFFPDLNVAGAVRLAHYMIAIGATAGAIVGVSEVRAIERAQRAQQARTRAKAAEMQSEQLEYLNSLLRHEVLNNATAISGYTELVADEYEGVDEEYLQRILQQSEDMAHVVTDVRMLIDALQSDAELETIDLSSMLQDELSFLVETHDSTVVEDVIIPDDLVVHGDSLLHRVFRNILMNAVEHNDSESPRVSLAVAETGSEVKVEISDNGPGIPPSRRDTLFEQTDGKDHGLGLYLVRVLVSRYGGTVELTDSSAAGSVFTVRLPTAASGQRTRPGTASNLEFDTLLQAM